MATKAQMYAQMADHAAVQLTSSWNEWMRFLDTASRLYKYPFHDQLMIYAQRPDATASRSMTCGMTRWAAMSGAAPRASPWWTIPGTGPGCGMSLTSPTPEPARTPALPGSGRWRNGI